MGHCFAAQPASGLASTNFPSGRCPSGVPCGQRKCAHHAGCAGGRHQLQILIDHVRRIRDHARRIEQRRPSLRGLRPVEPDDLVRARRCRHHRRLNQPLQIHREMKSLRAQPSPHTAEPGHAAIVGNHFVDERIAGQQRHPSLAQHPAHAAVRKTVLQARDGGQAWITSPIAPSLTTRMRNGSIRLRTRLLPRMH